MKLTLRLIDLGANNVNVGVGPLGEFWMPRPDWDALVSNIVPLPKVGDSITVELKVVGDD